MKRTTLVRSALVVALTIPVATFAATTTSPTTTKQATHHVQKQAAPKVNVNTATREQLLALPGMNDATAQKIIAGRPFQSVDQLLKENLVTKEEYSKIHSRLIAKPMASEAAKK